MGREVKRYFLPLAGAFGPLSMRALAMVEEVNLEEFLLP
jgi:hypothetical protein